MTCPVMRLLYGLKIYLQKNFGPLEKLGLGPKSVLMLVGLVVFVQNGLSVQTEKYTMPVVFFSDELGNIA